jgi:hypothetical protein
VADLCSRLPTAAFAVLLSGSAAMALPHYLYAPSGVNTENPYLVLVQDFHTRQLPTWELQSARKRMIAGRRISFDQMRAIADAGDGLAAFRYAERLLELDDPALLDDAAHYFASAAHTGRDYAVAPLLRVLVMPGIEISEARLKHIETALRRHALRGNAKATEALIGFYSTGTPFGLQPEAANELQQAVALGGDPEAAIAMALRAMSDPATTLSDADIEALLQVAVTSENLGQRTTAENILSLLQKRTPAAGETPTETGENE